MTQATPQATPLAAEATGGASPYNADGTEDKAQIKARCVCVCV